MHDDASLLNDYLEMGDQTAFRGLVERHLNLVYNVARRQMENASLADEVAQEVFIRLARKARRLRGHSCLVGWLHTTTRYVVKEVQRREFRRQRKEEEARRMSELHDNAGTHVDIWNTLRPVIDDVLAELSEPDRVAVLVRFFENKPLAEVGERLGISENAARMRIDRALTKLQARLIRHGIPSTASALTIALTQQTGFAATSTLSGAVCSIAISSAATGPISAALLNVFTIMTATKTIAVVSGSIAVIALGTAVHETQRARRAETQLAAQNIDIAELKMRSKEKPAARPAETEALPNPANIEPRAQTKIVPEPAPPRTRLEAVERLLVSNPRLASLYVRQETIRYGSKYGPLYEALSLEPAEVEQFERILGDYAQAASDIRVAALTKGLKTDDPAVFTLLTQASEQRAAKLQELLGTADYDRYKEYEQTVAGRGLSNWLATEMYYTEHPVSRTQADELARIALRHSAAQTKTGIADWDAILAESKQILSPEQLRAIQTMKAQAELGMEISKITDPVVKELPPE